LWGCKDALPLVGDATIRHATELLIEEEAAHTKVHTRYNFMLAKEGYPVARHARIMERQIKWLTEHTSLKTRLAMAACVEHITGSMGIVGLDSGILETTVDERMKKVWVWHLLEEIDHRSASFDLYTHLRGGYIRRVTVMLLVFLLTTWHHTRIQWSLLLYSGDIWRWSVFREGFTLWKRNGFYRVMMRSLFTFFKPGFHPSHIHIRDALGYRAHRYRIERELAGYFPAT